MKNLKVVTGILTLAFVVLMLSSCKDTKKVHNHNDADQTEMKHSETAMVYACPMKCEGDKTYDKEGKCPTCGMDLKEVKTDTEEDHSGHNH
jgi:transcription initiation factor IIE alpha subunit